MKRILAVIALLVPVAMPALGQSGGEFEITRATMYGSGNRAHGGDLDVQTTIGQPDAGETSGDDFEMSGGFAEGDPCEPLAPATDCVASDTFCAVVQVTWLDHSAIEIGYEVYRDGELLEMTGPDVTVVIDSTVVAGAIHDYFVVTVGDCYATGASNVSTGRLATDPVPPDDLVVEEIAVLPDTLAIHLTWNDNSLDEVLQIVYLVTDTTSVALDTLAANIEAAEVRMADTGELEYCFAVAAVNCGMEEPSASACGNTDAWVDVATGPIADAGMGRGVAWGDFDGDGDLDLYLSQSAQPNRLFRHEGAGVFVDVTADSLADARAGRGVAWGDVDNDGDLDLYLANFDASNKLFRNDGGGVFGDATAGPLGDPGPSLNVAWVDYDYDGKLDLYVVGYNAPNLLLRNEGDGVFVDAASGPLGDAGPGRGVAWGDYDRDGDLDLYLSSDDANLLLRNDGGEIFVDVTAGPLGDESPGRGVAWGDFDGDGDLDLYLANSGQANRLFRNEGLDAFSDVTAGVLGDPGTANSVAWIDYDNDADLDLYVVNDGQANRLLRNDGTGQFDDATGGAAGDAGSGHGATWGDFDADGDPDLYLAISAGPNLLVQNRASGANHWFQVDLVGTISNAAAIGARVRVVAGGASQIREISGGSGYWSQNALRAGFGLAAATLVDTVEVRWPRSAIEYILAAPADQAIVVVEGTTVSVDGAPILPLVYRLYRSYPNPFNPSATIRYDVPEQALVTLRIYNVTGRLVRLLIDSAPTAPGRHRVTWFGREQSGRAAASGVYFYRLDAGAFHQVRRMVLLK